MRCSCPNCDTFMIHSDRDNACVCPECLARCYACQGTGTALTQEQVQAMIATGAAVAAKEGKA